MTGSNPFIHASHAQTASFVDCGLTLLHRVAAESEGGEANTIDFESMTALGLLIDAMQEAQRHLVDILDGSEVAPKPLRLAPGEAA